MPILARLSTTTGSALVQGGVLRLTMIRPLQADASQTPSLLLSYLDCFISSLALASSPAKLGDLYGSKSWPRVSLITDGGITWVAIWPKVVPPQARRMPALFITKLAALRTWMSSKGGVLRFMKTNQVRSAELLCRYCFLDGSVTYWRTIVAGGGSAQRAVKGPRRHLVEEFVE